MGDMEGAQEGEISCVSMDRGCVMSRRKPQTEEERGKEFILQNRFWWGRTQGTGIDKRTLYSVEETRIPARGTLHCNRTVGKLF